MATTDPQALLAATKCYACYAASPYMLDLIELGLLAQIAAISGGSNPQVMEYTGADPTTDGLVPADPTQPAIAYKQDGSDVTYGWNTALQVWN